jgi:hypothetical protein
VVIEKTPSAGNSSFERSDHFTDNLPLLNAAYQIAEYDVNGRVTYTSMIRSACHLKEDWKVWPNPVTESVWFNIVTPTKSKVVIRIFDSKGALVLQQQNDLLPGHNLLKMGMSKMAAGSYQIVASWSEGQMRKTVKLLKL